MKCSWMAVATRVAIRVAISICNPWNILERRFRPGLQSGLRFGSQPWIKTKFRIETIATCPGFRFPKYDRNLSKFLRNSLIISLLFCSGKRWLEYIILCSIFLFHGKIFALKSILNLYHICFLISLYYMVYFTMSTGYQNDDFKKTKRFTDSVTVSAHSSVLVYACYHNLNYCTSLPCF